MSRPWRYLLPRWKAPSLKAMWNRQRERCAYCRRPTVLPPKGSQPRTQGVLYASRDHRHPTSRGGDSSPGNLLMACEPCNQTKGDMPWAEWVAFMAATPRWWEKVEPLPAGTPALADAGSWGLAARGVEA